MYPINVVGQRGAQEAFRLRRRRWLIAAAGWMAQGAKKGARIRRRTVKPPAMRRADGALRQYRMTSRCNRALLYSADEPSLLREVCRVAVDEGGYRLAWAGFAEENLEKSVRIVASHGPGQSYLDGLTLSWAESESGTGPGHGPAGIAIREGRAVVGNDFAKDAMLKPWSAAAKRAGFRSSIALPLRIGGRIAGTFCIYADA